MASPNARAASVSVDETGQHTHGELAQPLAVRVQPFIAAVWQEIAAIERGCRLEARAVTRQAAFGSLGEQRDVADRRLATPGKHARAGVEGAIDFRPDFPEMVPFPPQVRQGLRVARLRPEAAGHQSATDSLIVGQHETGQQLLLARRQRASHGRPVDGDTAAAEQVDANGDGAWHVSPPSARQD